MEDEGHIDLDSLFLEDLSSFDAFPSSSDLDQHSISVDSSLLIQSDDSPGSLQGFILVEGKTSIYFSGDVSLDAL